LRVRGEMIDIGGRRLRLVREGRKGAAPTILLEAGAFGFAADFGALQPRLAAKGLHVLAYDRAGLGLSDAGPKPRDGLAVVSDLEALLGAAGEDGPFVLVGHSMAGLYLRIFAGRHPDKVAGIVLLDAATPEGVEVPQIRKFVGVFAQVSNLGPLGALLGVMPLLSLGPMGDKIGLPPEASAEKRRAFRSARHNYWAALEVGTWVPTAAEAKALPPFDADLPVAVVTAGETDRLPGYKALQAAPALASRHPFVAHVAGAGHNTLLGPVYADEVVRAVEHVLAARPAATRRAAS
jgi:pimeloyl-ACP methyl ester carboxylesterase